VSKAFCSGVMLYRVNESPASLPALAGEIGTLARLGCLAAILSRDPFDCAPLKGCSRCVQPPFRSSDTQAGMGGFHIPRTRPRDADFRASPPQVCALHPCRRRTPLGVELNLVPSVSGHFPRVAPISSVGREARATPVWDRLLAGVTVVRTPRGCPSIRGCAPTHTCGAADPGPVA
jgi:hypothetical protein